MSLPLSHAFGATAVQVVADPTDWLRVIALAGAAALLGVLGLHLGWAAPVVAAGALTAVVVSTQGWVLADALPRWVTFAITGLALVSVSASYERQLVRLRAARSQLGRLR
ncbi:MAG: SCO7613 C-terminal domain-containing membrane protein [Egibacteraceae bacterium]